MLFTWFLASCRSIGVGSHPNIPQLPTSQPALHLHTNLFSPLECSSYCWAGIEVNKTSFYEAKEILVLRYGEQNIKIDDKQSIDWESHGVDGLIGGYVIFLNDIVGEIGLTLADTDEFTVRNVLEIFGEPKWIQISSDPINYCFGIRLLYPSIGSYMDLNVTDVVGNERGIYPSQRVVRVRFLQTKMMENWNVNDGSLVEWDGYKDYCP